MTSRALLGSAVFAAIAAIAACSSDERPPPLPPFSGDSDSGTGGTGAGGKGGQAGKDSGADSAEAEAGGDAGQAGSAGAPAGPWGQVKMASRSTASGTGYEVSADFRILDPCTWQSFGSCEVGQCDSTPPAQRPHAGAIHVTGGLLDVVLTPETNGYYPPIAETGKALFAAGASLNVTADGADVPAFQQSLTAPASLTITAPALPTGTLLTINKTQNLALQWSVGTSGSVRVTIQPSGSTSNVVRCTFPASAGQGEIPAAALAGLPPPSGFIEFASITQQSAAAGSHQVDVLATTACTKPDGTAAELGVSITE